MGSRHSASHVGLERAAEQDLDLKRLFNADDLATPVDGRARKG